MRHSRRGVATYLQTFVLIAVALGGSVVAYREVSTYAGSAGGAAVRVWGGSIRQGPGAAFERLTVSDDGQTAFGSFTVMNPGLDPKMEYCYAVTSSGGSSLAQTCPAMAPDPASIVIASNMTSGSTVVVLIFIEGSDAFVPGKAYSFFVDAPGAPVVAGQLVVEA